MEDVWRKSEEYFRTRYLEAKYGLWNSVITINGIIISSTTILFYLTDISKIFVIFMLLFPFVSCGLLLLNYWKVKNTYYSINKIDESNISERKKEQRVENALKVNKSIEYNEKISLILLMVTFFTIFGVIVFS